MGTLALSFTLSSRCSLSSLTMFGGIAGSLQPVNPQPAVLAGQLSGGSGPPVPPAPPLQPGGSAKAVTYLRQRLSDIRTHHPRHEMFGPISAGRLIMPFHDSTRANSVCWWNAIESCCTRQMRSELQWGSNACWMTKTTSYKITKQESGKTVLCKSFKAVRLFAFLIDPTDLHWAALSSGDEKTPFDHWCGRGEPTDPLQQGYMCINGVEHGEFTNRANNEERKLCKNGARVLCPGHGPKLVKCVFTHPDGSPRPCRNNLTHVPVCVCNRRCY